MNLYNQPFHTIGIHGVPRSGTSWLGQIFNSSPDVAFRFQPLFSYAFKSRISDTSTREEILDFLVDLYNTTDDFILQRGNIASKAYPTFIKDARLNTLVYKEVRYHYIVENLLNLISDIKIVGIVRNPCAVINSWIHAPKEFIPEWNIMDEWRLAEKKNKNRPEEFYGFNKWKEVASLFLRLADTKSKQFFLIRYEHLNKSPLEYTRKLFDFCNLEFSTQTEKFINESKEKHNDDPYAVFKKKQEDDLWRTTLKPEIIDTIRAELTGTELEQFLYA